MNYLGLFLIKFLKKYFCYILHSSFPDRFYIGHTGENLNLRLRKHLSNHNGFTARAMDWIVVYSETFPVSSAAYKREMEIKSWKSMQNIYTLLSSELDMALSAHENLSKF